MGTEKDTQAVVDTSGRVYGVRGLRIASLSIAPTSPDANTMSAAFLLSTIVADKTIEDYAAQGIA